MFETLDDSNFMLYAAKYYDNPAADVIEFEDDLKRIKYIKRLLHKYRAGGELRERLILNHLIVLYNVFYHESCTRMLCFRLYDYLDLLKPFLVYLNYWPDRIDSIGIDAINITGTDIAMNTEIIEKLRKV